VVTTGFARLKDGAEVTVSPSGDTKPAASPDAGTPQASAGGTPGADTASINAATPANMQGDLKGEFRQGKRGDHKRGDGKRGPRREAGNPPGSAQ
jgi:membrane fusion protein, multidrug efflux system